MSKYNFGWRIQKSWFRLDSFKSIEVVLFVSSLRNRITTGNYNKGGNPPFNDKKHKKGEICSLTIRKKKEAIPPKGEIFLFQKGQVKINKSKFTNSFWVLHMLIKNSLNNDAQYWLNQFYQPNHLYNPHTGFYELIVLYKWCHSHDFNHTSIDSEFTDTEDHIHDPLLKDIFYTFQDIMSVSTKTTISNPMCFTIVF